MRGSAASRASRSPTRERGRARAAADLDDRRRPRRRQRAGDGLGAQPVVDLVEQVVVGEVVEPERQPRGGEEDLLAGLLAAQELRHVLDHRAHDGEGRQRARDRCARACASARSGSPGGSGPRGAVDAVRLGAGAPSRGSPRRRACARNHAIGTRRARREAARRATIAGRGRRPASSAASRPSSWTSRRTESSVKRSKCSAQRMNSGEKSARMRRIRDAREQRVEVFGPRRHAADCSAGGAG